MELKYNIGDTVYVASWESSEDYLECPDCGGTGRIRVILHSNDEVSIPCATCAPGYGDPTGKVKVHTRTPTVRANVVSGMEIGSGGVEYKAKCGRASHWSLRESDVFGTEADAMVRAIQLAKEADDEERARVLTKEFPTRTWAWNASYHRRKVKELERDLLWHKKKLNAAVINTKEQHVQPPL